jgi:hypothetical protein
MPRVVIANAANEDTVNILGWSHENFCEPGRLRYEALLTQAIIDIAESPDRQGCVAREELAAGARTYRLWYLRKRPSPLLSCKPNVWACGIIRTIGWGNFLDDRSQTPHMKLTAIDKAFGVGESTGQGKSKLIPYNPADKTNQTEIE